MDECFNDTYTPPKLNPAEAKAILMNRRSGHYSNKETRDEALVCVRQLMEHPSDKVFTLVRSKGIFNCFDTKEFLAQIQHWRTLGVIVYKCNILPIKCGAYGDAWMMTVTPPEDTAWCPLALAFNTMVDGFTYISLHRGLFDVCWSALGKHE